MFIEFFIQTSVIHLICLCQHLSRVCVGDLNTVKLFLCSLCKPVFSKLALPNKVWNIAREFLINSDNFFDVCCISSVILLFTFPPVGNPRGMYPGLRERHWDKCWHPQWRRRLITDSWSAYGSWTYWTSPACWPAKPEIGPHNLHRQHVLFPLPKQGLQYTRCMVAFIEIWTRSLGSTSWSTRIGNKRRHP